MKEMMSEDSLMTVTEFARLAGITRQAVYKMIREDRIKPVRINAVILLFRSSLEEYLSK